MEQAIETRQRAIEILKDYEFKADKVQNVSATFSYAPAGSANFAWGLGG